MALINIKLAAIVGCTGTLKRADLGSNLGVAKNWFSKITLFCSGAKNRAWI